MSNVHQLYSREDVDTFLARVGPRSSAEIANRYAVTIEAILPLLMLMQWLGIVDSEPITTADGVEHVWMAF